MKVSEASFAAMAGRQPKLPLGVRKLLRLMALREITPFAFATMHGIDRFKLARILKGDMKRIDIEFIGTVVRAWGAGAIDPLDFEQRTVDMPDPAIKTEQKMMRAVGAK